MRDLTSWQGVVDDLMAYRRSGEPSWYNEAVLRPLLSGMHERYWRAFNVRDHEEVNPAQGWNCIVENGLAHAQARSGWITRDGLLLSAQMAFHERLLTWLGLDAHQVECWGWARVGGLGRHASFQCLFRLSDIQRLRVEECGVLVDKSSEALKPRYDGGVPDLSGLPPATAMMLQGRGAEVLLP